MNILRKKPWKSTKVLFFLISSWFTGFSNVLSVWVKLSAKAACANEAKKKPHLPVIKQWINEECYT